MTMVSVTTNIEVNVDVRDVMKRYINEKCNKPTGYHLHDQIQFALKDLADILISLGKKEGIKIRVSFNDK